MPEIQKHQDINHSNFVNSQLINFIPFVILNIFIGVVLIIGGFSILVPETGEDGWLRVTGATVNSTLNGGAPNKIYPIVSYTVDGQDYQVQSKNGVQAERYLQESYDLYYNPQNPTEAEVVRDNTPPIIGTIMIPAGIAIIVFALLGRRRFKRRQFTKR